MAKTFKQIMEEARRDVPEQSVEDVGARIGREPNLTLLDVREKEEYREGHLEKAISLPRGFLEIRVEETVPDKQAPIVAYCAGGTRSLIAARTLREMDDVFRASLRRFVVPVGDAVFGRARSCERRRVFPEPAVFQLQCRLSAHRGDQHAIAFGVRQSVDALADADHSEQRPGRSQQRRKQSESGAREPRAIARWQETCDGPVRSVAQLDLRSHRPQEVEERGTLTQRRNHAFE